MTLSTRIMLIVGSCVVLGQLPQLWLSNLSYGHSIGLIMLITGLSLLLARYFFRHTKEGLGALETGMLNLKDGEFSTTIADTGDGELRHLCSLYNSTVENLRAEKHWLYQRELLLDKVTQSSPDVLLLINPQQQIVFSNVSARSFFNQYQGLEGKHLYDLKSSAPAGAYQAIREGKQGLFSLTPAEQEPQTWHLSTGTFLLNNHTHQLFILKQMTRELSRQEVAVWKKVIRVISHELNNSLGPISSMLHSGKILSKQVQEPRLERVFSTIDDRMKHLIEFVQGYGKFAKLPEPKIGQVAWQTLMSQLAEQWVFNYDKNQTVNFYADPVQLEQLLINLLKNAYESGSKQSEIAISISLVSQQAIIKVVDKGKGIAESILNNVLIPFYSTKPTGSGLGLALCREIVEAHHGQIALYNRQEGGLEVKISLPQPV